MEIDWREEANREYTLYPAATYKVVVRDWELTQAKISKVNQVLWRAQIQDHPEFTGMSVVEYCALTEKALFRIANFVQAAGVDLETLPKMEVGSPIFNRVLDSCKGRTMYWRLIQSTYNGKTTNKVEAYARDLEQPILGSGEASEEDLPPFLQEEE